MARPDITGIGVSVNTRGRKKNFFTLMGTNFDVANVTLVVVGPGNIVWQSGIIRGQSSATRLVCWVKTPARVLKSKNDKGDIRVRDIETLDVTVTNPGPGGGSDTQHEDVDVIDESNP